MKLTDSGSMREYTKSMIETFDELSAIGDATSEEDKVVYLLTGLPESYDVLVTVAVTLYLVWRLLRSDYFGNSRN